jgi:hypothetical protein
MNWMDYRLALPSDCAHGAVVALTGPTWRGPARHQLHLGWRGRFLIMSDYEGNVPPVMQSFITHTGCACNFQYQISGNGAWQNSP